MIASLPPLPVDDVALDLYWSALHPEGEPRTSIGAVLKMMAELAGADLDDGCQDPDLRDPCYHPNDLISRLITALRNERASA